MDVFAFEYDFPTTRSRRGTLSSISSRDDPVTPSVYTPTYVDAVMEISTDDCRRVYPISTAHTFGNTSIYEFEAETPVSGGALAESVCEVVIEEPETPVKPTSTKKPFFPGSLIVEGSAEVEEIEFSLPSQSPILNRQGKVHPFSGGRRRASISAVANAGGVVSTTHVAETLVSAGLAGVGGLAKMMAFEEIESRGGSDIEDSPAANIKDKKRRTRRRKTSVSNIQQSFAKLTFNQRFKADEGIAMNSSASASDEDTPLSIFKFEKRPISSYSCSPATSNPGSDDEFTRARSCSPSPFRPSSGLGALLNSRTKPDFLKLVNDRKSSQEKEVECYEVPLDEDFVSKDVESVPSSPEAESAPEQQAHEHKMCADDFEQIKVLGKGTFGTVLLVRHKATGKLYAQKQLKKAHMVVQRKLADQVMTEKEILEAVRHPFVVKLFYAFQDHEKLYLILEYAEGGELFLHLALEKTFSEDVAAFYVACLVLALSHLHTKVGVVYRDLKPENCLLDEDGYLLLTDFGLSKVAIEGSRCRSMLGTVEYMAPEVIEGKEYGAEVDWWGVGALLVDLLTGNSPFAANNDTKIRQNITKKKLVLPYYLSADAKDLITKLLCKNPAKRLGSNMPKDLATIKKHRFFRKIDWAKLEKRELTPPIIPVVTNPELAENFSADFTMLPMSPVTDRFGVYPIGGRTYEQDQELFGGFSYVAQW